MRNRIKFPGKIAILLILGAGVIPWTAWSMGRKAPGNMITNERLEGLVQAPEFPGHLEWLNTAKPLSLASLRGKMVLLDFWTYCCINCMHVIPDLKKLEDKYPDELVVLGVHSAKFENEKQTENIRQAILRYEIKHPVINDRDMEVWQEYAVHAWPTIVLINPRGRIIGVQSGEGIFDLFDSILTQAIPYFDQRKELKRGPLALVLEEAKKTNAPLSFPGKIHADSKKNRLFITDSNHHRILVADPDGNILDVIGNGKEGSVDGDFGTVLFHHPQGTFADGGFLYIADTENHLVRRADLQTRQVTTILGTGRQSPGVGLKGRGTQLDLSSPWDLLVQDGKLFIAMAGTHQIYVADLSTFDAVPHAGSGREARLDGPLLSAALAQPSGIATDGRKLYFADSEVSSIRSADTGAAGKVETIIGEDLFEFGDIDGPSRIARLQHPLGIAYSEGLLYVADTYNSKIKIIDPGKLTSKTLAGSGKHGFEDGSFDSARFFEPGGIAILGNSIFVADTNNHQIRVLNKETKRVSTLVLKGLEKYAIKSSTVFHPREVHLPEQKVKPGHGTIRVNLQLPEGYKLNLKAPVHVAWKSLNESILSLSSRGTPEKISLPIEIPFKASPGKASLEMDAVIYYCADNSPVCLFDRVRVHVPMEVSNAGASVLSLDVVVQSTQNVIPE